MSGFSRFGFKLENGKLDNNTRAFLSSLSGRIGGKIPNIANGDGVTTAAVVINAIAKEFTAQGWVKKGFDSEETDLISSIQAVTMIPAATEWAYAPYEVFRDVIVTGAEFIHTENAFSCYDSNLWIREYSEAVNEGRIGNAKCDWATSLNQLNNEVPNCKFINLFVSWYGTDLRAGSCALVPGVTRNSFANMPHDWSCAGYSRSSAHLISTVDGSAAYGGTPDDQSVIDAIKDLHARGVGVAFTPFILMDVPGGNTLQDPYTGSAGQPVYPWRGRITKAFATADKSAACAAEVAAFVAQYRDMVLHYAALCATAGGVEAFILGTELRGLTWLRDASGAHPFVQALIALAADTRALLPNAKLTYASDWTEFTPYVWNGQDLIFHLDPLWADSNIDALGIDIYWPLSDWRDGITHLDYHTGRTVYDYDYLMGNIKGGEGYTWYYASQADRDNQIRTPITDGGYNKPWVFRYKDIWNWWSSLHYDRVNWVEQASHTSWAPQSKPLWFTELGFPSVDKGPNQPNVFYDPKSSESALPYYAAATQDCFIQRRGLHSILRFFNPSDSSFIEANNPQSSVYSGRMVDISKIIIYTWDARPYPQFPLYTEVWSDGPNWVFGHWIVQKLSSYTTPAATGELKEMGVTDAVCPSHPYIVDPANGQLDAQYKRFFESIGFTQADAIQKVPLQPTMNEVGTAVNALLDVLRNQKRIAR
jgi:hypothetical protein